MTRTMLAALVSASALAAHAGSSASYTSDPQSLNGGGGVAVSANNTWRHTIGEGYLVSATSSASYTMLPGFWRMGPGGVLTGVTPTTHLLTVLKAGAGTGTVTSDVGAIDCGSVCTYDAPQGQVVTLTATPTAGSTFAGWSGACTGTGMCAVTMSAPKSVSAFFDPPPTAQSADMAISQTASVNPVGAGKDVMFTITATNNGPANATSVTIQNTLVPPGPSFIWASPGCAQASGVVTCAVGALGAGASKVVKVVMRPLVAAAFTSNAVVAAAESDPVSANNSSALAVTVAALPPGIAVARYRLYSDVTKEHHFTTDLNEYNVLGTYVGTWVQEGTVGKVLNNPGSFNGVVATPYYRLYDTSTRWHHWTTDANEYYTLIQYPNWNGEGVDGYLLLTNPTGTTQLFRLNYPYLGSLHHWTIDANEYNTLIGSYGWIGEGGSGFVIQ